MSKNIYAVTFVGESKPTIVVAEGIESVPEILRRQQSAMSGKKTIAKLELLYERIVG
jgi:hypothetical protein